MGYRRQKWYSWQESNLYLPLRRGSFYPLNYKSSWRDFAYFINWSTLVFYLFVFQIQMKMVGIIYKVINLFYTINPRLKQAVLLAGYTFLYFKACRCEKEVWRRSNLWDIWFQLWIAIYHFVLFSMTVLSFDRLREWSGFDNQRFFIS